VLEAFRGLEGQLLSWLGGSKHWSGPEMPASQALLLWLIEAKPQLADKVLSLASHYENALKQTETV